MVKTDRCIDTEGPGHARALQKIERLEAMRRLTNELTRHVGEARAIGMGELFSIAFQRPYGHRINSTRPVRDLVEELRWGDPPMAICSSTSNRRPGYFIAQTGPELEAYIKNIEKQGLKKLALGAKLRRQSLPDRLGQLALEMQPGPKEKESCAGQSD